MLDAWVIEKIQEQEQERSRPSANAPTCAFPCTPPNSTESPEREEPAKRGYTEISSEIGSVVDTLF